MDIVLCRARARRGIVLLELLIYMSLMSVVLVLAAVVFNRGLSETAKLQGNITDIERTMKAGERWRADVRAATGPIMMVAADGRDSMVIPQGDGEVVYKLGEREVRRGTEVALKSVKAARMIEERRGAVVGWRWEVELEGRRKNAKVRPLFTFMAVPGGPQ